MKKETVFGCVLILCFWSIQILLGQSSPSAVSFRSIDIPSVPSDLKETCLSNPNSGEENKQCPVLVWNKYVYWAFSYRDNRMGMCIVAYTEKGVMVKRWDKSGARYISKIGVDETKKAVTLIGQAFQTITVGWDELYLPVLPEAGKVPASVHPKIPDGSKMVCFASADVMGKMDTCMVLQWKSYTYWAYSYYDNRVSMNIVVYDDQGNIVKQWEKPGARYLYNITVDPAKQTVTFWGQANQSVAMTWSDLLIQ